MVENGQEEIVVNDEEATRALYRETGHAGMCRGAHPATAVPAAFHWDERADNYPLAIPLPDPEKKRGLEYFVAGPCHPGIGRAKNHGREDHGVVPLAVDPSKKHAVVVPAIPHPVGANPARPATHDPATVHPAAAAPLLAHRLAAFYPAVADPADGKGERLQAENFVKGHSFGTEQPVRTQILVR